MELSIKDCTIVGKDIIYYMSTEFTKFYLGYKHNKAGVYPPYIDVKGKEVKRFERDGMAASYDIYRNGNFRLLIKYRK